MLYQDHTHGNGRYNITILLLYIVGIIGGQQLLMIEVSIGIYDCVWECVVKFLFEGDATEKCCKN